MRTITTILLLLVCWIRQSRFNWLSRSLLLTRKHTLYKTPHRPTARHGTSLWTERYRDLKPGPNWFHGLGSPHRFLLLPSPSVLSCRSLPTPFREHPHSLSRARPYARTIPRGFLSFAHPFLLLLAQPGFRYLSFSFSFPLSLPPSSRTVPLLPTLSYHHPVALDFRALFLSFSSDSRSSSFRSHSNGGWFFSLRLPIPSRTRYAMFRLPNTDPSRTNDRTTPVLFTGSTHDQPFLSFSLIPLWETARLEVHPLPRTFRISPTFASHVLPHPSFASWPAVPFRNISTSARMYILAPDFLDFSTKGRGSMPANPGHMFDTSTRAILLESDRGETVGTGDLFIILASKQAARRKGRYNLFFPLWPLDLRAATIESRKKFPPNEAQHKSFFAVYDARWKTRDFI